MRAALAPRVGAPASTSAPAPAQPRGAVRVCAARSPWTAARRVASSETRLSLASPRGVSPRPHAVASPPSSVTARRASGRDVSSRASSLAGWTHGFGDADASDGDRRDAAFAGDASDDESRRSARDDASSRPRAATILAPFEAFVARLGVFFASAAASAAAAVGRADAGDVPSGTGASFVSTTVAFRRLLLLCVAAFSAALLAQHVFTWPGFAAVAPAAAFATGNLGAAAFPLGTLTKSAAFLASAATQTVSLAGAAVASAASGAVGYAAAAEKASAELAELRAELAELRVAVATAAAAARRSGDDPRLDAPRLDAARVDGVLAALGAKVATAAEAGSQKTEPEDETASSSRADALSRVLADAEASARDDDAQASDDAQNKKKAAKAAELAELRARLARLRAVWAPERALDADRSGAAEGAAVDEAVDWNARARARAVWTPPAATSRPRVETDETKSSAPYGQTDSGARVATLRALAAARADLAALRAARGAGDAEDVPRPPGSLEARADLAVASTDYASLAKARALWSPGAPGDALGDAGGDAGGAGTNASFRVERCDFDATAPSERRAAGASDEAAETARLEAEDRAWRRRLRMDAASEDPFGDAR